MIIGLILSFLSSSGFGSILGGIMGYFNRKIDMEQKKLDLLHEKDKWGHELALRQADLDQVKAEAAGRREVAVVEGESSIETARMVAIGLAQAADRLEAEEIKAAGWWGWTLVLADACRRFIRPGLTVLIVGMATYVNYLLVTKLTGSTWQIMTPEQQHAVAMQALAWLGSQAGAVCGFWFVSRGSAK